MTAAITATTTTADANRSAVLARLRAEVARLEGAQAGNGTGEDVPTVASPIVSLGLTAVDAHLPGGGLARGRVHEVTGQNVDRGADESAAALGAALWFVSRFCARPDENARPFLWATGAVPYAPGLADFGLDPGRLILARGRNRAELLWAAEEGLGTAALGAVLVEADGVDATIDATSARRLALAARASGVPAVLLRSSRKSLPITAETRWRVAAAPNDAWDLELVRARGTMPRRWRGALIPGATHGENGPLLTGHDHEHEQQETDGRAGPAGAGPVAAASARGTA